MNEKKREQKREIDIIRVGDLPQNERPRAKCISKISIADLYWKMGVFRRTFSGTTHLWLGMTWRHQWSWKPQKNKMIM